MGIKINQYGVFLILVWLGLNASLVYGENRKIPVYGGSKTAPDHNVIPNNSLKIFPRKTVGTNNSGQLLNIGVHIGVQNSDREDGCFWTKRNINQKECNPFLSPVVVTKDGQYIANFVEAIDCAHVSILQSVSKACQCAEKRVDVLDTDSERDANLKEVSAIEHDTFRRVELEKNLEKIIVREYLFTENLPTCDVSKRFKILMNSSRKQSTNHLTEEKRKFCSPAYNPSEEINLFKNLQNGGIPLLDFEETIKAGLDLVSIAMKNISPKDVIRMNKLLAENRIAYNAEIKEILSQVRKVIGEYLESEDSRYAAKFIRNNCSDATIKNDGNGDLCSVLKKLNSYSLPQKKSLKIALETFTEDNDAVEASIKSFIDKNKVNVRGETKVQNLEKMKHQNFLRAKMSLISKHNFSCDNVLGDREKEYPIEVDTIKKYCLDNPREGYVSVIENLKNEALKFESKKTLSPKQKTLKQYAIYQYCSAIRRKLAQIKEQKNKGEIEGSEFWVEGFMKSNDIPQACLETNKTVQDNRLSASMVAGNGPPLVTEQERFISPERPNLFTRNPSTTVAHKQSVSRYGSSNNDFDLNSSKPSVKPNDTYTLGDKNTTPGNYVKNYPNSLKDGSLESSSNIGAGNFTNLSPRATAKSSIDRKEDDNVTANSAVDAYKRLDSAKQMDVIKNSNNQEMLQELLREALRSKNKDTKEVEEQNKLVSALKDRIAQLEKDYRNTSDSRKIAQGNTVNTPLAIGGSTPSGSRTILPNNYRLPDRPYVPVDNRSDDEIRFNRTVSSGAGSPPASAGKSSFGESGINSKIINNKNGNFIQIPKKELEFYKSLKDLDVAKAGEEGDFIKIELVDCPPDVSRTQDDKCVLLKNDVYVPLSIYMKGIAEKNEKYLAQIKTENKENAKNPEEPRARHDILKKEL
ncbi:MAG: hypothetical protein A2202_06120 [Bdellovibrionales bacterium RIFOXYA1_FULL_36_14]|nr:MAG: hypothetical protein A2202_06120 [Bdellovibrionales bacterium RIFOXYA1_FULL_36_14]